MTDALTIRTNYHRRELVSFNEAGSPADFDYIASHADPDTPRLFKYRGSWYDVDDGFTTVRTDGPPNLITTGLSGWHGFQADSHFSGIAVRYLHGDDEGFIVAALVMA